MEKCFFCRRKKCRAKHYLNSNNPDSGLINRLRQLEKIVMQEIKQLLEITQKLRVQYQRSFSLDGRLVGDIGEVLAAVKYGLELYTENTAIYDGFEKTTGRKVQIKAFKNYSYFPFGEDKTPDYFLSINILENGELEELYNGPGHFIVEHYIQKRNLKHYKETFYTLSKGILRGLNKEVPVEEKIKIVTR